MRERKRRAAEKDKMGSSTPRRVDTVQYYAVGE